ncbi:hypothetical protein E4T56_gene5455 [Termitomyces sp. T112]|nr:hypothetical protein E4T56_gene5455 [Termitomyces sp. T112]
MGSSSSSPPERFLSPPGVYLASSSPPVFTFSSTPPNPISSSSPSWSDGSTTTVSTTVELGVEPSDSAPCVPDEGFMCRLRELLGEVERRQNEDNVDKAACVDVDTRAGDDTEFINTYQATFDLRALLSSTSSTGAEVNTETDDTDFETDSFSCTGSIDAEAYASPFTDLSPIVFAPSQPLSSPLLRIHLPAPALDEKAKAGFSSRIIHRASSYLCPRKCDDFPTDANSREETETEPPRKRSKILTRTSTHTHLRTNLARTPASLRRAASLRSIHDSNDNKENVIPTAAASPSSPPTVLVPPNARMSVPTPVITRTKNKRRNELIDVPIIAPPDSLPPLSTVSPARVRIQRLVERERGVRVEDGLEGLDMVETQWGWECVGEDLRDEVISWFMEVLPPPGDEERKATRKYRCEENSEDGSVTCTYTGSSVSSSASRSTSTSTSVSSSCTSFSSTTSSSTKTCTGTISPTSIQTTPSSLTSISLSSTLSPSSIAITTTTFSHPHSYSDSTSTSHSRESQTQSPCRTNLADQLLMSPETRFHAAYLFLRFFWLVGRSGVGDGAAEKESGRGSRNEREREMERWAFGSELDEEGRRLVTWDVGVACLGISIKYHRDFLHPLLPVYAQEFMKIAPHGPVGYDDLETAHRDVLGALQFRLGDTPQGLLGEVWEGVPGLRRLLRRASNAGSKVGCGCSECGCGRRTGKDKCEKGEEGVEWNLVQRETWRVLCAAVIESDVLKYPLSLLTASALLHGLCVVLVRRYEDVEPWYMYELCAAPGPPVASSKWRREREARAERAVQDVKSELMGLVGADEVSNSLYLFCFGVGIRVRINCVEMLLTSVLILRRRSSGVECG